MGGARKEGELTMPYDYLSVTHERTLAVVTLNRPERRNALSLGLMLELIDCLDGIGRDPQVRAVILAAAGKVFSSGHDLSGMVGRGVNEYRRRGFVLLGIVVHVD